MVHIFKIPEGARNVKSFIEEQTVLTVEDFERGEGTLRVAFHHHEVSLEQLVAFQAAIDAEYLVERPGKPTTDAKKTNSVLPKSLNEGLHDLRGVSHQEAYDLIQCDPTIKEGHLLIIDNGIAILNSAWPTMVHGVSEVLHAYAEPLEVVTTNNPDEGTVHTIALADGRILVLQEVSTPISTLVADLYPTWSSWEGGQQTWTYVI